MGNMKFVISLNMYAKWKRLFGQDETWPKTTDQVDELTRSIGVIVGTDTLAAVAEVAGIHPRREGRTLFWSKEDVESLIAHIVTRGGDGSWEGRVPLWMRPQTAARYAENIGADDWCRAHIVYVKAHFTPDDEGCYWPEGAWYEIPKGAALIVDPAAKGRNKFRFVPRESVAE